MNSLIAPDKQHPDIFSGIKQFSFQSKFQFFRLVYSSLQISPASFCPYAAYWSWAQKPSV